LHGAYHAFNGLVRVTLIRYGADYRLPKGGHNYINVYSEMLLQICMEYPGLPDALVLEAAQIRFFYAGLRAQLIKQTGS